MTFTAIRTLLSPVMTMTRMPASRQFLIASMTSLRGGSNIPTRPTNVQFVFDRNKIQGYVYSKLDKTTNITGSGKTEQKNNHYRQRQKLKSVWKERQHTSPYLVCDEFVRILQIHVLLLHRCVDGGECETAECVASWRKRQRQTITRCRYYSLETPRRHCSDGVRRCNAAMSSDRNGSI